MTTIFTGSNYGFISTGNSGTGTIVTGDTEVNFNYENVNNYNTVAVLLTTSGGAQLLLRLFSAATVLGAQENYQEVLITKTGTHNYTFYPNGPFVKVQLYSKSDNITYTVQTRYQNAAPAPPNEGIISALNSFIIDAAISANEVISGTYEDVSNVSIIKILTAGDGLSPGDVYPAEIKAYFSSDGVNNDRIITYPIQDIAANGSSSSTTALTFNPAHTLIPLGKFYKADFINGVGTLANVRVTTSYHNSASKPLTSRATQFLTDYFDADTSRSILVGRSFGTTLPGGHYQNIGVSNTSLNVAIRNPSTAFGQVEVAENTPSVQIDFSNGYTPDVLYIRRNNISTTSYTYSNSVIELGVSSSNSIIEVASNAYTKYKTGQGLEARYTALFPGYVEGANQFAGLTNIEDQVGYGYFDSGVSGTEEFCIYYQRHGLVTIAAFNIVGTASGSGTITYNFGGTNVVVSFTTGETAKTIAYNSKVAVESVLNLNTYGWVDDYFINLVETDATVIFYYNYPANVSVSALSSGSGITVSTNADFSRAGSPPTTEYIPQSQWNLDTCKDMGSLLANYNQNSTGFRLEPNKGNIYVITIQYLGFGAITFSIENTETGYLVPVHQVKYANNYTITNLGIPSFRIGYILENTTNTSSLTLKGSSVYTAIQGKYVPSPIYRSYGNTLTGNNTSVSRSSPRVIFGLQGRIARQSVNSDASITNTMNRNNVIFTSFSGACIISNPNQTANITFVIVRNPTSITYSSTSPAAPWVYNSDLSIFTFDGTTVTSSDGVSFTGGSNVIEFCTLDNNALSYDLTNQRLAITPDDTLLIAYYGGFSGSTYDIIGSISWFLNI